MPIPTVVTFQNMERSEALETRVHEKMQKLERFADRITRCRVTVEAPNRKHQQGGQFDVRIDLHLAGTELVVNGKQDPSHEDAYVALRDAFAAAVRQLEDHVGKHSNH